ncbi:MAG: outer membrane channel protein [Syntrophorhabdus sp. PtaU1.Bin058]|nr:MAG: outer membrane channel protein [Syntrophorhabdus sp. PtaU1.Bin058]
MGNTHCNMSAVVVLILLTFILRGQGLCATVIDFDTVAEKAVRHSQEVRMSDIDIRISQSAKKEALSTFYPLLSVRWNSGYVKDLTDGTAQVTSVGDVILLENTMFQNALSLGIGYDLYDFGAKDKRVFIAYRDVDLRMTIYAQSVRNVKVKVLSVYSDLLLAWKELAAKKELLGLYRELSAVKERLFVAGRIAKVEMTDDALNVVKTLDEIDGVTLRVNELLHELSVYTGEDYVIEDLEVKGFSEEKEAPGNFRVDASPEWRMYELAIEKKRAEIEALERERYPKFAFNSNYTWYGQDLKRFNASIENMRSRNFFVGLSVTMPLFDGFKSSANIEKARLEMERLKIEKEKKVAELRSRQARLSDASRLYGMEMKNRQEMLAKTGEKLAMVERLAEQKIAGQKDRLIEKIEMVNRRLELAKASITKVSAVKELKLLTGEVR